MDTRTQMELLLRETATLLHRYIYGGARPYQKHSPPDRMLIEKIIDFLARRNLVCSFVEGLESSQRRDGFITGLLFDMGHVAQAMQVIRARGKSPSMSYISKKFKEHLRKGSGPDVIIALLEINPCLKNLRLAARHFKNIGDRDSFERVQRFEKVTFSPETPLTELTVKRTVALLRMQPDIFKELKFKEFTKSLSWGTSCSIKKFTALIYAAARQGQYDFHVEIIKQLKTSPERLARNIRSAEEALIDAIIKSIVMTASASILESLQRDFEQMGHQEISKRLNNVF